MRKTDQGLIAHIEMLICLEKLLEANYRQIEAMQDMAALVGKKSPEYKEWEEAISNASERNMNIAAIIKEYYNVFEGIQ